MLTIDSLAQEIRRVDGNHSLGAGALAEALMPFISAALSIEQTQPVKVRALEWTHHDGNYPTWRTLAPHFEAVIDKGEPRMYGEFPLTINGRMSKEKYGTLEAAQTAAQADFERRVGSFMRSALVNAQADVDVVERLKEALKAAAEELDRISCVPRVTETSDIYDQFERAKFFADRGASAAWATVRSLRPAEVGSATSSKDADHG